LTRQTLKTSREIPYNLKPETPLIVAGTANPRVEWGGRKMAPGKGKTYPSVSTSILLETSLVRRGKSKPWRGMNREKGKFPQKSLRRVG
jgi:hypothetical protein